MTAPRRFDLIVFDWDGTLYDSTALIARCIQSAAADLGVAVPTDEQASHVIGLGLVEALRYAMPGLPRERYHELADRYRHHYLARQHEIVFFDGALTMLNDLRARGHRLAVATGKTRRGLDEVLHRGHLDGLFDATRTADETASKPDPRMLRELIEVLVTTPERTVMIGDTTHDLQMARDAGCAMIGVGYGAHDHRAFTAYATEHVAHDVVDLHAWLVRNG